MRRRASGELMRSVLSASSAAEDAAVPELEPQRQRFAQQRLQHRPHGFRNGLVVVCRHLSTPPNRHSACGAAVGQ